MASEVRAATPADIPEFTAVWRAAFHARPDSQHADEGLVRWKYFEPIPGLPGARLFSLRDAAGVHAVCGVFPIVFQAGSARVTSVCFLDWASADTLRGAGIIIMQRLLALADTAVIGLTSDATKARMPKLGFVPHSQLGMYARVVRPFRQFRVRPRGTWWKGPPRLARNLGWSLKPAPSVSAEWSARRVSRFTELTAAHTEASVAAPECSAGILNYWLNCPAGSVSAFFIERQGRACGYFLLSRMRGQARIADVRITSAAVVDWTAAYALATAEAARYPDACEIAAVASHPLAAQALENCGFRHRGSTPLFVYDPGGRLAGIPLLWNFTCDDTVYVDDCEHPFWT